MRWAEHLYRETIVLVEGEIKKPPEEQGGEVKSTSNHGVEVSVKKVRLGDGDPTVFIRVFQQALELIGFLTM